MTVDMHPDDRTHVEAVVAELRGHRRKSGIAPDVLAAKIGRSRSAINSVETEPNRRTGSVQAYAYALDLRIVFHLAGVPDVFDPTAANLTRMARQAKDWRRGHSFERAALGAQIGSARRALGRTQVDAAGAAGRDRSFFAHLEQHDWDDPLLGVYQQAARALGGMLQLRVVPNAATDETRLRALLEEVGDHAVVAAVRYRAVTPVGALKGLSLHDAQLAVAEHGGTVEHAEVWLLPTRHEVLGPWLPYVEGKGAAA